MQANAAIAAESMKARIFTRATGMPEKRATVWLLPMV